MQRALNPLIKVGIVVISMRSISILIYYFDSSIVATPAHLVPMALFTHLAGMVGYMLLITLLPDSKISRIITGCASMLVFPLYTFIGELHFALERLSGQSLHWNIVTAYVGSGLVTNMDVLWTIIEAKGPLIASGLFVISTIAYTIYQSNAFITKKPLYVNISGLVSTIFLIIIAMIFLGPGSKHYARNVVKPPEWNLWNELTRKELKYTPEEEHELINDLRRTICSGNEHEWVDHEYPIMRKPAIQNQIYPYEKPDIFVLCVESLRGSELQKILLQDSILNPYTNIKRLAQRGVYFKNFISNGYPTVNGIFSMHTSTVPHLYKNNITSAENVSFDALAQRIKNNGYRSLAYWGGNPGHVNELKWARKWFDGFDFIVPGDYLVHSRNRSDAEVYRVLMEGIENHDENYSNQPLFAYVFTGMTHKPYKLENAYFSSGRQRDEAMKYASTAKTINERYIASLQVLDLQIGKLMKLLDTRNKYDNTIIVLLGDHSMNTDDEIPPEHAGFPVDDLVWTGAIIAGPEEYLGPATPRVETFPSSQADLIPTFINILNDTIPYTAFGHDLFSKMNDKDRVSISVGSNGSRIDTFESTTYFSHDEGGLSWIENKNENENQKAYNTTESEQTNKARNALKYWSSLVDQNRVWKNKSTTDGLN